MTTIGIIGAGNMGSALARGWGEAVLATDAGSGRAAALVAELGGEVPPDNSSLAAQSDVVVLCHKPAQLQAVAGLVAGHARAVISVLSSTSLSALRSAYPGVPVARVMPNTPVELRQGVTCLALDPDGDDAFAELTRALFARVGTVVSVPERLMEVATGLSGVLPAYLALFAEAQIDAGIRHGLPAPQATELVTAALPGAAAMLRARGGDTLAVRREVASPGGLTARGLEALEHAGLRGAFADALAAVLDSRAPR
jgi:pyrroline-5-carboxylate reductase